jgi:GTP-binding protein
VPSRSQPRQTARSRHSGAGDPAAHRIAIVGRPNVGKSTLFNRLTGTRAALVSDLPGLTRDRREGEASIAGHAVTIVDTAGLEDAAEGSIPARMREQSEQAIRDADLVLFVIDARSGIVPEDRLFARIARQSGKPVVLAANKCEGRVAESGFYEAFELGLGDPVAVSAEHGDGIGALEGDMLAALGLEGRREGSRRSGRRGRKERIDREQEELSARDEAQKSDATEQEADPGSEAAPVRVAIVGRPNAGKSTLVNTILGEERMLTGPEPGLTRDAVSTDLDWQGRTIRLFDTAGLRRKARITETAEKLAAGDAIRAIRFAEVVVLLVDPERALEQQDLVIGNRVLEEGRALVIAVNKWDAVEEKQKVLGSIRETVKETFADAAGITVVTVSALSGRGVDKLMQAVLDAHAVWNRRIGTSALNRWLAEALARHTPHAARGRPIRIRFITQPSSRPPTFVAFCSLPDALPKSYVRYLVNSLREAFDMPGTPIRFNLRKGDNPYAGG